MPSEIAASYPIPPGPKGLRLVNILWGLSHDPLPLLFRLTEEYGDIVHVGLPSYHLYIINHPDYLYEMLARQAGKFSKPRALSRPIAEVLGNGLLVNEGDAWRRQRRLMQPAFHHKHLDDYGRVMSECILETLGNWENGCIYDIDREMMRMTLPMVTRTLFGSDIGFAADDVTEAVKIIQKISYRQGQTPVPLPPWVPLPNHLRKQRAMERLDTIVLRLIQAGRAAKRNGSNLLSMLIEAVDDQGEHLTDQQVRDEVMTVLLAGHESTANALTWMWYLLEQHPDVQKKLCHELETVLGGQRPTVDDLRRLPYNQMIVKEALRLYPPAWGLPREPMEDVVIGGYRIRKGSLVVGFPYVIQRDKRYYNEPDKFIPERFEADLEKKVPLYAYIPFGSGPRFCIGNMFALTAMQLILATVHQRYQLERVATQEISADPLLTLRPKHEMLMRVRVRS